jgi:hypothetical protein
MVAIHKRGFPHGSHQLVALTKFAWLIRCIKTGGCHTQVAEIEVMSTGTTSRRIIRFYGAAQNIQGIQVQGLWRELSVASA